MRTANATRISAGLSTDTLYILYEHCAERKVVLCPRLDLLSAQMIDAIQTTHTETLQEIDLGESRASQVASADDYYNTFAFSARTTVLPIHHLPPVIENSALTNENKPYYEEGHHQERTPIGVVRDTNPFKHRVWNCHLRHIYFREQARTEIRNVFSMN